MEEEDSNAQPLEAEPAEPISPPSAELLPPLQQREPKGEEEDLEDEEEDQQLPSDTDPLILRDSPVEVLVHRSPSPKLEDNSK